MARFACPSCSGQFEVAAQHQGQIVRCPHCDATLGTGLAAAEGSPMAPPDQTQRSGDVPLATPVARTDEAAQAGLTGGRQPNPAGVWSLALAILFYLGQGAATVAILRQAAYRQAGFEERMRQIRSQPPVWMAVVGTVMLVVLLGSIVLGVYGVTRRNRRKGAAIAGLVMSGLALLLVLVDISA